MKVFFETDRSGLHGLDSVIPICALMFGFDGPDNNDIDCQGDVPTFKNEHGQAIQFVRTILCLVQATWRPYSNHPSSNHRIIFEEKQAANNHQQTGQSGSIPIFSVRQSSALRNPHPYYTSALLKMFRDTSSFTLYSGHSRSSLPRVHLEMSANLLSLARIPNGQSR